MLIKNTIRKECAITATTNMAAKESSPQHANIRAEKNIAKTNATHAIK